MDRTRIQIPTAIGAQCFQVQVGQHHNTESSRSMATKCSHRCCQGISGDCVMTRHACCGILKPFGGVKSMLDVRQWEKTCDAMGSTRDLSYVQLIEVLLPGSSPRKDIPQESCWLFGAVSWGAFLHSPSHWARLCLWEASKSLLQTSSQLPLQ